MKKIFLFLAGLAFASGLFAQSVEVIEPKINAQTIEGMDTSELVARMAELGISANTIWVDGTYASTTSTGSRLAPFTTIVDALAVAVAGDVIAVMPGSYNEHVEITVDSLTLISYAGPQSTFIEFVAVSSSGIEPDAYAVIDGFTLSTNTGFVAEIGTGDDNVTFRNCVFNTKNAATMGISVGAAGCDSLLVENCTFYTNTGDGAIWLAKNTTNAIINDNRFFGADSTSGYAIQAAGSAGDRYTNNFIDGFASGIFPHTVTTGSPGTYNILIEGNTIRDCSYGIRLGHSSMTANMDSVFVNNNTLFYNSKGLYIANAASNLVESFIITGNNIYKNTTVDYRNDHASLLPLYVSNMVSGIFSSNTGAYLGTNNPAYPLLPLYVYGQHEAAQMIETGDTSTAQLYFKNSRGWGQLSYLSTRLFGLRNAASGFHHLTIDTTGGIRIGTERDYKGSSVSRLWVQGQDTIIKLSNTNGVFIQVSKDDSLTGGLQALRIQTDGTNGVTGELTLENIGDDSGLGASRNMINIGIKRRQYSGMFSANMLWNQTHKRWDVQDTLALTPMVEVGQEGVSLSCMAIGDTNVQGLRFQKLVITPTESQFRNGTRVALYKGNSLTSPFVGNEDFGIYQDTTKLTFQTSSSIPEGTILEMVKSRGTVASKTSVNSGDTLGNFRFMGYDGTNFIKGASIYSIVDAAPGSNDMPASLNFAVSPDGGYTPLLGLKITNNTFIGLATQTPYHSLSAYSSNPAWTLTDTDVNKNTSSAAQAIDTSAISLDVSSNPTIYIRGVDGDAGSIAINTSDGIDFNNFSGGLNLATGNMFIPSTYKLYLDGGDHTYISQTTSDLFDLNVGGENMIKITEIAGIDKIELKNAQVHIDSSVFLYSVPTAATEDTIIAKNANGSLYAIPVSAGILGLDTASILFKYDTIRSAASAKIATKYDVDTLSLSVYDSLSIHLDTIQSHNDRLLALEADTSNFDTVNTPTFTTDIQSGTATRVLVIPAGYWVEAIKIIDIGTAAGLSAVEATQETSSAVLITGKSVATTTTGIFKTIADHQVYATAKNLTFTATGNGGSGMSIVVYLRK